MRRLLLFIVFSFSIYIPSIFSQQTIIDKHNEVHFLAPNRTYSLMPKIKIYLLPEKKYISLREDSLKLETCSLFKDSVSKSNNELKLIIDSYLREKKDSYSKYIDNDKIELELNRRRKEEKIKSRVIQILAISLVAVPTYLIF